jgi:APA family basic amino acid/polyamine antiporter
MTEQKAFVRKTSGLVRQASLFDTFAYNVAASSFVGALAFYFWTINWLPAGNLLAAIPAVLPAFSIALIYAMLTATMPRSGGDYVFNSRILSPSLGFAFNFSLEFWQLFFMGFNLYFISFVGLGPAINMIGYLSENPALVEAGLAIATPTNAFIIGTILNLAMMVITLMGTRKLLVLNNILFILMIAGSLAAIGVLAANSQPGFQQVFNRFMAKFGGPYGTAANPYQAVIDGAKAAGYTIPPFVFAAPCVPLVAGSIIWTFYESYIAGEVKRADSLRRNLLSMAGAGLFNIILLTLLLYFFYTTLGYEFTASVGYLSVMNPEGLMWADPAMLNTFFMGLIAQNVALAAIITIGLSIGHTIIYQPCIILQCIRCIFAWSMDRLAPEKLSEVNPRFKSPFYATIAAFTLAEAFLITLMLFPGAMWTIYASTIIGPAFSCMFLPAITAILLPYRRKDIYEVSPAKREIAGIPVMTICGVVGAGFMLFLAYEYAAWPGFGISSPAMLFLNFGMILVGFVLYWVIRAVRRRQGIDIDLAFKEIPPI